MTDNTQTDALRLSDELRTSMPCDVLKLWAAEAAAELRRQHARIAELEAQLSAIGAGGVSPLMNAAQEATHLRELAAYRLTVENLEREIAQQPAPSPAAAGWKLVPVEPTEEMLKAADDGDDAYTRRSFGPDVQRVMQGPYDHYCAMLDAAPTAQADSQPAAVRDYPPLPAFDSDGSIWNAICKWEAATPGSDAHRKANAVESAIIDHLRAYVDADRAARAPADSVLEDAARLDWLLLRISGAEFRRLGVHYSGNARRADVDAARKQGETK